MNKKTRNTIIFGVLTVALTVFIFTNSLRPGDDSSAQSDIITNIAENILNFFGISLDYSSLSHFIRKLAHFSEYFILGIVSSLFLKQFKNKFLIILSPVYCFIVAVCDEFIMQAITEGRGPMWFDVLIDSSGAIFALLVVLSVYFLINLKSTKKGELV